MIEEKIIPLKFDLMFKKVFGDENDLMPLRELIKCILGIEDKAFAKTITKGDVKMEEIIKKVEEFSDDEEILGAYNAEEHREETEMLLRLGYIDEANQIKEEARLSGIREGIEQGIEQGSLNKSFQIASNMLKEKMDIELISKVTGLDIDQIKELKD